MGLLGELLHGAIKPDEVSRALQPVLKDAEAAITEAVSSAIHGGLDRISGAKITITIELPAARATAVSPRS